MLPIIPLFLGAGLLLVSTKKKAMKFDLVESGSVAMLPQVGDPELIMQLHVGQMIELIAVSSPAATWEYHRDGSSAQVLRRTRMQDSVTQMNTFSLQAVKPGWTKVVFEKTSRDGKLLEMRHIKIEVP